MFLPNCNCYPYLVRFLEEYLIVFTQSHTKYNGCDVFKAMDPLLPFTPLAANIEHAAMCQYSHSNTARG